MRRDQRGIDTKDLKAALLYGIRTPTHPRGNGDRTASYTYQDITYIVNEETWGEVTSYIKPLTLDPVPISDDLYYSYQRAKQRIKNEPSSWTSNTVMIVDTSGSMKEGDMWGTRNRLGSVWVSIALDFLARRLELGEAGETDVVSIVTMGDTAEAILMEEPTSWVLFNTILSIYNNAKVRPYGHGNFLQSLKTASILFKRSTDCSLSLTFLTDGAPSDPSKMRGFTKEAVVQQILQAVVQLASIYGKRLSLTAIGIGSNEEFTVLKHMVHEADDYGAEARFLLPSMTTSSLAEAFSSVASSLTTSQSEMSDRNNSEIRRIRSVKRESKTHASVPISNIRGLQNVFNIFAKEKVQRQRYTEWHDASRKRRFSYDDVAFRDPNAKYVALCQHAFGEGRERFAHRFYEIAPDGVSILGKPLVAKESRFVIETGSGRREFVKNFCMTQQLVGRLANEFNSKMSSCRINDRTPRVRVLECSIYNITRPNGEVLSLLVEERLDVKQWHKWNGNGGYVEGMCGEKLDEKPDFQNPKILRDAFLNLSKVDWALETRDMEVGRTEALPVGSDEDENSEPLAQGSIMPNGAHINVSDGHNLSRRRSINNDSLVTLGNPEKAVKTMKKGVIRMETILEESDEEDQDKKSAKVSAMSTFVSRRHQEPTTRSSKRYTRFRPTDKRSTSGRAEVGRVYTASEVAHAFSHFTYWATKRKRLVCDLQGVFDEKKNEIILSDPAIHFHDDSQPDERRHHGRTDMGREGMAMFFATHHKHCGPLCMKVVGGLRAAKENLEDATIAGRRK
ncbi:hypothetical protein ACA910_022047 [Epithemia clementina (nom. ined.)]